jgi:hypothetical protein
MLEGRKGGKVKQADKLTYELKRNIDVEYKRRAFRFVEENAKSKRPFFLYFNHSLMHIPVVPRDEYKFGVGYYYNSIQQTGSSARWGWKTQLKVLNTFTTSPSHRRAA